MNELLSLHKKWSFPLRISSVNVTKLEFPADLVIFTEEIVNGKLHFLCSAFLNFSVADDLNCFWMGGISDRPHNAFSDICIYADDTFLYLKCDRALDLWQQLQLTSKLESDLEVLLDSMLGKCNLFYLIVRN